MTEVKVNKKYKRGNKYYFDLVIGCVRINNCFVEWDEEIDDFRVRFPTKTKRDSIYQVIWVEDPDVFDEVYQEIKSKFKAVR